MTTVHPIYDVPSPAPTRSAAHRGRARTDGLTARETLPPTARETLPPAGRATSAKEEAPIEATESVVRELEAMANDELEETAVSVQIDRDEESNRFVVKVLDENGQLLHQFPSEDFLATSVQLEELRGLLFEAKG